MILPATHAGEGIEMDYNGKLSEDKDRIPELWTVERVAAEADVSSGCIWAWVGKRSFPPPIDLGPRTKRWEPEVVRRHIADLRGKAGK
jgi:predicted DNA-binding transcriptional regulator AlpA